MDAVPRLPIWIFQKIQIGGKFKWHTATEGKKGNGVSGKKPKKNIRDCGVPESTIEEIRIYDRADFNSNRRFYRWTNDVAEYLESMQDKQKPKEVSTVTDLLDEIENESLYRALLTADKRTLQILLLKMQGYSTKEIAPIVHLTTVAIYVRLDHLRKKLKEFGK